MKAHDQKQNQKAVALAYDSARDEAPKIAAKGTGLMAENIIRVAREHGIPIHEDPDLVSILSRLELEEEIPPHLYEIVAEILAFLYKVNNRRKQDVSLFMKEKEKEYG